MIHKKTETVSFKSILKNIFFIKHGSNHAPLTSDLQRAENKDLNYIDYMSYYQQATRWK